jgi:hypothetical protein
MDQTNQYHPVGMAVSPDRFRSLEKMLHLIEVCIGIRIVNQLIEEVKGVPDRHFLFVERQVFRPFFHYKIIRLVSVIQPIEFPHGIALRILIVAVFLYCLFAGDCFRIGISAKHVIFPLVKVC